MVTGCGQWVVNSLNYLEMQYPTPLVTVIFSLIPTFCSIFVNGFILVCNIFGGNF